jgi:hypothetical protein
LKNGCCNQSVIRPKAGTENLRKIDGGKRVVGISRMALDCLRGDWMIHPLPQGSGNLKQKMPAAGNRLKTGFFYGFSGH